MRKKKGNGRGASGNNQLVAVIDVAAVDDFDFELARPAGRPGADAVVRAVVVLGDEVVVLVVDVEVEVGIAVAIYRDAGLAVGAEGIGPGVGVAAQYDPILTLIRYNTESFQSLNHMCNKPTYLKPMRICFDEYFLHLFASFWTDSCNSQWEIG